MFELKTVNVHKTPLTLPMPAVATWPTTATSCLWSLCPLYKNILCLIIGLIIGIRFTDIWFNLQNESLTTILPATASSSTTTTTTAAAISTASLSSSFTSLSETSSSSDSVNLFNTTRVLCWILTNPANHLTKAIHILHTWGRRCNKLLFMSSEEDETLHTVKLNVAEGRENLWNKTRMALKYIYDHHIDEAEWFLKADDDTYVIMENLRYFLHQYPSEAAIYFGAKFKRFVKQGYMSGGAGYVLSKMSLRKFGSQVYDNPTTCPETYPDEDVQLGLCLQNAGIIAGDSRDVEGNERFLPLPIEFLIPEDKTWWYKNYTFYEPNENSSCCSTSAISFHYIQPDQFYVLDYFLYALKVYGANKHFDAPQKIALADILSKELENFKPIPEPPFMKS